MISQDLENEFSKNNVHIVRFSNKCPTSFDFENLDETIITFEFEVYWRTAELLFFHKGKQKLILYSVHPYTFDYYYTSSINNLNLSQRIFFNSFSKYIRTGVKNHHIFFMDEQCLRYSNKTYNLGIKEEQINEHIVHILYETNTIEPKKTSDRINILSVSRADFPFKGYLKGLIDEYSILHKTFQNISLTIISSGEHINILKEWIDKADTSIKLVEGVQYSNLASYYKNADLYVGMGTTILEASAYGVISVPISPYTYECNASGLFIEKPEWLLTEVSEGEPIHDLMIKLLRMDAKQVKMISDKSMSIVKEKYSEDAVMRELMMNIFECSNKTTMDDFPCVFLFLRRFKSIIKNKCQRLIGDKKMT